MEQLVIHLNFIKCVCMFVGGSVLGFSLIIIKCSVGDPEFG